MTGVATIDEQLGGADAGAGLDLFEHGGDLALVGAAVGDADANDGARGVRGGGELDVEGDRTHLVIGGHLGVEVDPPPGDLAALRA
ncbi:MAG TPA: hypothetical protein VGD37_02985 [Kofleriaceae bacterium]